MTASDMEQRFPGAPAPAASQATIVEQTRAAAEVVAAVRAAREIPRDPALVRRRVREACADYALAEQAFYSYRMGGEDLHGPTVVLARELAAIYGNIDFGTQELDRDDVRRRSEVRAFCRDLETNAYSSRTVVVPHVGFTGKHRDLTKPREVDQNNNSVAGRALREQVFAILPAGLVSEAKAACYATLERGQGVLLPDRIAELIRVFGLAKPPVTVATLEGKVGRAAGDWTASDVASLDVLFQTLRRKEISREEAFPDEAVGITSDDIRQQAAAAEPAPPVVEDPPGMDPTGDPNWGKGGDV